MRSTICSARVLPDLLELGLHLQHGRQRGRGHAVQHPLERVQRPTVSAASEDVGGLARSHRRLDRARDEFGVARLPALGWDDRRSQFVASGDGLSDDLVVQVSFECPSVFGLKYAVRLTYLTSFLIKDAQEEMHGARLKA